MIYLIRDWFLRIENQYINPVGRQRAIGVTIVNLAIVVGLLVAGAITILLPLIRGDGLSTTMIVVHALVAGVVFATQRFILNGNLRLAIWILIVFLTLSVFAINFESIHSATMVGILVPVVAAGLLLNRRELGFALMLIAIGILVSVVNQTQLSQPREVILADEVGYDAIMVSIAFLAGAVILYIFSGSAERFVHDALLSIGRYDQLSEFSERLDQAQDENTLFVRVSELVIDKMLYSFSQLHLYDNEGQLNAHRRTGMGTRHAVSRTDSGSETAVGQAIRQQEIMLVSLQDSPSRRGHLLPSSTYGVLIPLVFNKKVIGVLDVQSNQTHSPFTGGEIVLLKLIGRKFTTALTHLHELNNLQLMVQERDTMNTRLQNQVADLRRRADQIVGSEWGAYLEGRSKDAYGFDLKQDDMTMVSANDLPDELRPALESGETVVETTPNGQIINVPIMLRNEILGAMAFALPRSHIASERQLEMAKVVSERLALALENARLVEQSQNLALRERKASEIASILIGQQEVDSLLNIAAHNFNEALGAVYTHIYLEPEAFASFKERL
jgi:GAF domain-containing protein